jgi:Domain of unknown function (DUF4129)
VAPPPKDTELDPIRAGGAVVAVVLLLAVVALAAAAAGPSAGGADRNLADPLATLLFVLGAIWVAGLLVASPILTGLTLTGGAPRPRRWHGNVFAGVIFLTVVLAILVLLRRLRPNRGREPDGVLETGPTRTDPDAAGRVPTIDPASIDWLVVGLVFASALVGFAILAAVIVRPRGKPMAELEARKQLESMLDETLEDLQRERDPRKAVIAAYARMEQSLGVYGLPRRPWEAPLEYLGRVLAELTGSGSAARRLTKLFERAKFSEHSIDPGMKDDAISAVSAVRDELRALMAT